MGIYIYKPWDLRVRKFQALSRMKKVGGMGLFRANIQKSHLFPAACGPKNAVIASPTRGWIIHTW